MPHGAAGGLRRRASRPRPGRRRRSTRNCTSVWPGGGDRHADAGLRRPSRSCRRRWRCGAGSRRRRCRARRSSRRRSRSPRRRSSRSASRRPRSARSGRLRSMRAVLPAQRRAGAQAEALPAPSTRAELDDRLALGGDRVRPCRPAAELQLVPPSVEVAVLVVVDAGQARRSAPLPVSDTRRRRSARPSDRRSPSASLGAVRSSRTVLVGAGAGRRPRGGVAERVHAAELHQRLALGRDGQRAAGRGGRPGGAAVGRGAELVPGRSRPARRPSRTPMTVAEATLCQASEPPVTAGAAGPLRSMRTVLVASGVDGAQAETLPAASTLRNCTSVSPSARDGRGRAGWRRQPGDCRRRWTCGTGSRPGRSRRRSSRTPRPSPTATLCQDSEPPLTAGAVGALRSIRTVLPAIAVAGRPGRGVAGAVERCGTARASRPRR